MSRVPAVRYERHLHIDKEGEVSTTYIGIYMPWLGTDSSSCDVTGYQEQPISASGFSAAKKRGETCRTIVHVHELLELHRKK